MSFSHSVFSNLKPLENFRRLCILKGVFPREPKKKVKGNHHTYYHLKDISFLQHDPLLEKFREIRAYEKKIKKAEAKKNKDLANRLLSRKPGYTLDRLIRERFHWSLIIFTAVFGIYLFYLFLVFWLYMKVPKVC